MNAAIGEMINEIETASRGAEVRSSITDVLNELNAHALPDVTAADAGKVLTVDGNGEWTIGEAGGGDLEAFLGGTITELVTDAPSVGYIYNQPKLERLVLSKATKILALGVSNCPKLKHIEAPLLTDTDESWNAVYNNEALESVSFPSLVNVPPAFLNGCGTDKNVIDLSLPAAVTVADGALRRAGFRSVDLPEVTTCQDDLLEDCDALTTVTLPKLETAGNALLSYCAALTSVSLPALKTTGSGLLQHCDELASAYLPALESYTGGGLFQDCGKLTSVDLSSLKTINGYYNFSGCTSLQRLDLPSLETIPYDSYFCKSSGLTALILRYTGGVVKMYTGNQLESTPISAGNGHIYVPSDLVDAYKDHYMWSKFSAVITSIDELPT